MVFSSKQEIVDSITKDMKENFEISVDWRRHLHQHPELSFKEYKTKEFIVEKLSEFGLEVKTGVGGNGVIATLQGAQEGPTIALRADFDALPITDLKDVAYKSQNEGAMHACGHDGHTAALLSTAKILAKYRDILHGKIVFIFQHAEETPPGGAKFMVEDGALDGVDYVFGAHLDSSNPVGNLSIGDGYRMAAVDKFKITLQGLGGHGARPQDSIDSIVLGGQIVTALQQVVSRRLNPFDPAVVTVGVFHAGSAFNIIADSAVIEGTVRTMTKKVREKVQEEIYAIVNGLTEAAHAQATIDYLNGYPALYNHPKETAVLKQLFEKVFGKEHIGEMEPSMGAEDFAYYLEERPGSFFKVGSNNGDSNTKYPHHHPKFDFDERALLEIQKAFLEIVAYYLITE
ncbi:M20 metallopeptidase family protein [Bacillus massiliigorillae]|uniref:M20 metallopeptidase family protein n=1 Tax=Bacillus massiliigorillae TaxID=1243664 RepID=UPI0003A2140F|nr:amidohydrolase [Bacillus massiliigorillae]